MKWYNWTIFGMGIWLVLSPWILGFAEVNLALWNVTIAGTCIALLALWNMTPEE